MFPMFYVELTPTDYALRMRPAFIGMLGLLMMLMLGKLVIHDVWGAVCIIFVVLTGLFVLMGQHRVNASSALYYCVMAIISGIFDVTSCILYFQHSKYSIFHRDAPWLVLLAQGVFILSPVTLLASAMLSYSMFSDCRDNSQESAMMHGGTLDYGGLWEAAMASAQRPDPNARPRVPSVFQGQGQRLSDGD
mmetsp:Transcript_62499/g.140958  ORF Transcript_62499/g.140958 Transcript_62499/m.140958 type:complete len:191 (+) Transcript_62499:176-748(+)